MKYKDLYQDHISYKALSLDICLCYQSNEIILIIFLCSCIFGVFEERACPVSVLDMLLIHIPGFGRKKITKILWNCDYGEF